MSAPGNDSAQATEEGRRSRRSSSGGGEGFVDAGGSGSGRSVTDRSGAFSGRDAQRESGRRLSGGGGVRGRDDSEGVRGEAPRWTRGDTSGRKGDEGGRRVAEREDGSGTRDATSMLRQCKTLAGLLSLAAHVRSFSADQVAWALGLLHKLSSREQRVGEAYTAFVAALVGRGGACMRDFNARDFVRKTDKFLGWGLADLVYKTDKFLGSPPSVVLGPLLARATEVAHLFTPDAAAVLV
ncbi:hypothetical protein T484DRAFT_1901632 [Baffinella frigidus]|nr:hypothetical protein T484DRAFT_1901632 [Cryptophyta sp. CCMP2293]